MTLDVIIELVNFPYLSFLFIFGIIVTTLSIWYLNRGSKNEEYPRVKQPSYWLALPTLFEVFDTYMMQFFVMRWLLTLNSEFANIVKINVLAMEKIWENYLKFYFPVYWK